MTLTLALAGASAVVRMFSGGDTWIRIMFRVSMTVYFFHQRSVGLSDEPSDQYQSQVDVRIHSLAKVH